MVFLNMLWNHPSVKVLVIFGIFMVIPQLGVTVGYHRGETHKGWNWRSTMARRVFLILGALAGQGDAIGWVYAHWVHHTYQDQAGRDPHSPREYPGLKGLLWAHVGWMLCKHQWQEDPQLRARLEDDSDLSWQRRWYVPMLVAGFVIPLALAGWDGLLVAGFFRLIASLNCSWAINSVCHKYGRRAKDSQGNEYRADDSRDNRGVALITCGEGFHSRHHADPRCAYHGWKWYDFDPSKWTIWTLEQLRLIGRVRKPRKNLVFTAEQRSSLPQSVLQEVA